MEEWPPELTFLQDLEELMKCPICFDLMQAPVMLPGCDHNYCSLCIRRYFTHKEQCPTCSCPAASNQLRSNGIMEKTIKQFKKVRSPLLSICVENLPQSQTQESGSVSSSQAISTAKRDVPRSKKATRSSENVDRDDGPAAVSATRNRPASQPCSDSEDSDVQIVSEDESLLLNNSKVSSSVSRSQQSLLSLSASFTRTEGQKPRNMQSKLFEHLTGSGNRTLSPSNGSKSGAKENEETKRKLTTKTLSLTVTSPKATSLFPTSGENAKLAASQNSSPRVLSPLSQTKSDVSLGKVEKVPCPVCGVPVVTQSVNHHLDLCLGRQEKRSSPRVREKREPLPKVVYNLLSDKDIRKRLKNLGLNAKGDRQVLIKRHHEFTLYHNADCDSLCPKDTGDLVKEFEDAQKLQMNLASRSAASGQSMLRFTKDAKQEDIEKAQKEYAAQHKDQFKSLIKEARNRMKSVRSSHSASTCSTAPVLKSNVNDHIQEGSLGSGTTSATTVSKKTTCFFIEDDDGGDNGAGDNDVMNAEGDIQGESLEPETASETVISREKKSSATDVNDGDVTNDKGTCNMNACEDSVNVCVEHKVPVEVKMASVKSSVEIVDIPGVLADKSDLGDETGSDVFEYDHRSKCVRSASSLRGGGKRALRPSKPSWQDTDSDELSASINKSETSPGGSKSKSHKSNSVVPSSKPDKQERTLSDDSQSVNSPDKSFTFAVGTSETQRVLSQPETADTLAENLQEHASSPTKISSSVSPMSKHFWTQKHCLTDHISGDSPQLSNECWTNPDRETTNATSSDTGKPAKASDITVTDHSFDPATSRDCSGQKQSACFDLNLSDCEDEEELSSTQELDCADPAKAADLYNDQSKELYLKCKLTPATINPGAPDDMEEFGFEATDDIGETSMEMLIPQTEQETASTEYMSDVTKPKPLLKKGSDSAALFKKSVRFAGLRARISDIDIKKCKSLKKCSNMDSVRVDPGFKVTAETAVKIGETVFSTAKNGLEYQDKNEAMEKAGRTEKKKKAEENHGKEMATKGNKKKKKHSMPGNPPEDFTCLKELADKETSDTSAAQNSLSSDTLVAQNASVGVVDQERETLKATTQDKEVKAGCQPEKESPSDLIDCPIRSIVPDIHVLNNVTDQPCATAHKLPENSHKQCSSGPKQPEKQNRKKQKSESEHSPKSVLLTVPGCPAEQSVDTHQPKSKQKRKRASRSAGRDVQQLTTESSLQTETLENVPKRRKTSKSRGGTALHAVLESCIDMSRQSPESEQQGQVRIAPQTIPETCCDIPEKPVRAGRRKPRSSKSEDDTQHMLAMSQSCETEGQMQGKRKDRSKGRKRKLLEFGESGQKVSE